MQMPKISSLLLVMPVVFAVGLSPSYAFDASKVIKGETSSSKIFEFFSNFRKDGKQEEAVEVLKFAAQNGNSGAQWK